MGRKLVLIALLALLINGSFVSPRLLHGQEAAIADLENLAPLTVDNAAQLERLFSTALPGMSQPIANYSPALNASLLITAAGDLVLVQPDGTVLATVEAVDSTENYYAGEVVFSEDGQWTAVMIPDFTNPELHLFQLPDLTEKFVIPGSGRGKFSMDATAFIFWNHTLSEINIVDLETGFISIGASALYNNTSGAWDAAFSDDLIAIGYADMGGDEGTALIELLTPEYDSLAILENYYPTRGILGVTNQPSILITDAHVIYPTGEMNEGVWTAGLIFWSRADQMVEYTLEPPKLDEDSEVCALALNADATVLGMVSCNVRTLESKTYLLNSQSGDILFEIESVGIVRGFTIAADHSLHLFYYDPDAETVHWEVWGIPNP